MKKTLLLLTLLIWTGMQAVMAQTTTVKGKVVDENGSVLPFASVQIEGTHVGTQTKADGTFSLTVPDGLTAPVLEVRFSGYADYEMPIKGSQSNLVIKMEVTYNKTQDVIITGYGQATQQNYVGAANHISDKQIAKLNVTDVTQAIEGNTPGARTASSGAPGAGASVRIRGISSLGASNSPLYVVDGAPFYGDITMLLNSGNVASMNILKDATATSLYGSQGAAGVIVITTKKGKMGEKSKPKLNFSAHLGFVERGFPDYNLISTAKDYYEVAWQAYRNNLVKSGYSASVAAKIASGQAPFLGDGLVKKLGGYNSYNVADNLLMDTTGHLNPNAKLLYQDNWDDALSRVGFRHDYNLSGSGSSDNADYHFAVGYLKEDGYIKYSDYEKFNALLNTDAKINSWLKTGVNLIAAMSTDNNAGADGSTAGGYNPFFTARNFAPVYPVWYYNAQGQREIDPNTGMYKYDWGDMSNFPNSSMGTRNTLPNANVLGSHALDESRTKQVTIFAVPYMEAKFLKYFTLRTDVNVNLLAGNQTFFNNTYYGQFALQGGLVEKTAYNLLTYTWHQQLKFNRNFGKHHLDVLLDHENFFYNYSYMSATRTGLALPGRTELAGATTPDGSNSFTDNERMESYLGLANYNYEGKYFVTASLRYDGSSRFAPAERWNKFGKPFWALGASWNLREEKFMSDANWIDLLQVKASYGTQGNKNLISGGSPNYYPWQNTYDLDYANGNSAGAFVHTMGNNLLTWESAKQFNVGVNFSFFKHRLSGELDYFNKTNADLIYNLPLAHSSGQTSIPSNTATMVNKGFEVTLNGDIIRKGDFTWNASLNLTHYTNEITKMPGIQDSILQGLQLWTKGHSVYDYYLLDSHVDQKTGKEKYYYYDNGVRKDTTDNTYALNHGGRAYRGSAIPKLIGGFTNEFHYKGFDLSFMLSFGLGGKYYDQIYQGLMDGDATLGENFSKDILNAWTPENTNTDVPEVDLQNLYIAQTSTRFLIDGSYLNLRNVSLSYTFKPDWIKSAGFTSLRLSVTADNVFLLSKRQGMMPQATFGGDPDYSYSPARTVMFGIDLGL